MVEMTWHELASMASIIALSWGRKSFHPAIWSRLRAFASELGDEYGVELLSRAIFRIIREKLELNDE